MELCQYPCQNRTRYFTIEVIQIPIVYNRYGDYAPDSQSIKPQAVNPYTGAGI